MIFLARRNAAKIGAANVEFRLGEMEQIPVPDASVDAVISNCVVNLSPDNGQVFREVYRVLRAGGRLSISDIVLDGGLPAPIRASMSAWAGCIAGALEEGDYLGQIQAAGFAEITVQSRDYVGFSEAGDQDEGWSHVAALLDDAGLPRNAMDRKVASVRVPRDQAGIGQQPQRTGLRKGDPWSARRRPDGQIPSTSMTGKRICVCSASGGVSFGSFK
jgi:SAM-dependent methyltransferase